MNFCKQLSSHEYDRDRIKDARAERRDADSVPPEIEF